MFDLSKNVEIGKIVAPHGVRGEVRVVQLSEFTDEVLKSKLLYVDEWKKVERVKLHKKFFLIKFSGIDSIDDAEKLRGRNVYISKSDIGELPEGRFYIDELIGLKVYDTKGFLLGELKEIIQTGSNDVYIVKDEGKKDLLLPALKTVIKLTDIKNNKMIVDPPVWEDDK